MAQRKAVIFVREGEDLSIDEQERLCRDFVATKKLSLADGHVFVGKPLRRRTHGSWALTRRGQPELFGAIVAVRPGDTLVSVAPRFIDHEPLGAATISFSVDGVGAEMQFANGSDPSVLNFGAMRSLFAHHQKTLTEFKVVQSDAAKLPASGKVPFTGGMVPFGYELINDGIVEAHLTPVPEQQAVIARMAELRNEGLSYRNIGARLAEEGHFPPRRGSVWQPNSIKRALLRLEEEQLRNSNDRNQTHKKRKTSRNR